MQSKISIKDISEYKGWKVAIDVSGWLHKGLYGAAEDFVDSGFVDSQLYVDYVLNRVAILQGMGIEPVLVFDGRRNCLKDGTNTKRNDTRNGYLSVGQRLLEKMKSVNDVDTKTKLRGRPLLTFEGYGGHPQDGIQHYRCAAQNGCRGRSCPTGRFTACLPV